MKHFPRIGTIALLFLSWVTASVAHHSFAMFDRSRTETVAGTVKEFELINPHGWLRLMVSDATGAQNEWSLELGGAGQLERFGWTPNTVHPRFPNARHDQEAADLYLYARDLIQTPLLEYLTYYQVIEFYLPTYTRSTAISRVRNILKDPAFDYNNDLALGRLLETIAPSGKRAINEREQVATAIACCVDDTAISAFLADSSWLI